MSDTPTPDRTTELLLLGQIHGIVQSLKDSQDRLQAQQAEGFKALHERVDGIDERLRQQEQKTAVVGAVSGGVVGVGVALVIEGLKAWMKSNNPLR